MPTDPAEVKPPLRRAVVLMTSSSFLVPAAGVLTQPILARALGVDGRGQLAAAIAPSLLVLAIATLGLPDALTYHLARRPSVSRPALLGASAITIGLGGLCLLATLAALPFLSVGDPLLARLIVLAMALTIPALVVNVLRGAAAGRQMWGAIALERLIITALRVVGFGTLFLVGRLTVESAVLTTVAIPIIAGLVYWPLYRSGPVDQDVDGPTGRSTVPLMVSYGSKVWAGSVASMLLSRTDQVLLAPLSSVEELGLYSVAVTVSDVPFIVVLAVAGALIGVDSRSNDAERVTATARLTLIVGVLGCGVLGAVLPFIIEPLFGPEFGAATLPTLLLTASALVSIPGLMASAGLASWGRPGLRSIGLLVTLIVNLATFVLAVPRLGAVGACTANIIGNLSMSVFMVITASRVMRTPISRFVLVGSADVRRGWEEAARAVRRLTRRGRAAR